MTREIELAEWVYFWKILGPTPACLVRILWGARLSRLCTREARAKVRHARWVALGLRETRG